MAVAGFWVLAWTCSCSLEEVADEEVYKGLQFWKKEVGIGVVSEMDLDSSLG
jgi:hypothetical protein